MNFYIKGYAEETEERVEEIQKLLRQAVKVEIVMGKAGSNESVYEPRRLVIYNTMGGSFNDFDFRGGKIKMVDIYA